MYHSPKAVAPRAVRALHVNNLIYINFIKKSKNYESRSI